MSHSDLGGWGGSLSAQSGFLFLSPVTQAPQRTRICRRAGPCFQFFWKLPGDSGIPCFRASPHSSRPGRWSRSWRASIPCHDWSGIGVTGILMSPTVDSCHPCLGCSLLSCLQRPESKQLLEPWCQQQMFRQISCLSHNPAHQDLLPFTEICSPYSMPCQMWACLTPTSESLAPRQPAPATSLQPGFRAPHPATGFLSNPASHFCQTFPTSSRICPCQHRDLLRKPTS